MGEVRHLLVDARPVDHPTARNRGVGQYTLGLLRGLQLVGAPVVALYESDTEAELLEAAVPDLILERLNPATVRRYVMPDSWYLATQLMLHPIPLDPVPRLVTDAGLPVAAVLYDVIPERYPEQYQVRPQARAQVQLRGILTRTLDALLAISQFAGDTAADELRFPSARIRVIGAGVDSAFRSADMPAWPRLAGVLADDARKVVLMVSGADARKNTERMLAAWSLVDPEVRAAHRLVVVAAVNDSQRSQWQQWANDARITDSVTFTGGVTDDQMVALHQVATLAIMPSTEEGFGLPVLEAAACGCPVIVSNMSSLPEVLSEPAAEFDPFDTTSIARAVDRALADAVHREVLLAAGRRAVQRWTWANTGQAVMDSLAQLGPRQHRELRPPERRVALVGRFDESENGLANTALADALRALPIAPELHLLVDNDGGAQPIVSTPLRFPARALGRSVHRSLFDEIVVLETISPGRRRAKAPSHSSLELSLDAVSDATGLLVWLGMAEEPN
ncbi:MAG: glycosyltransferase family 4 protein [Ilumatobacteraceae bacterium]|nr:glycosyltransferase family 4 protein [Ilumatobacteraceae bacterium]